MTAAASLTTHSPRSHLRDCLVGGGELRPDLILVPSTCSPAFRPSRHFPQSFVPQLSAEQSVALTPEAPDYNADSFAWCGNNFGAVWDSTMREDDVLDVTAGLWNESFAGENTLGSTWTMSRDASAATLPRGFSALSNFDIDVTTDMTSACS